MSNNKRKLPLQTTVYLLALLLILLTSCVLSPIYMQIGNDVVFMYTLLPIVLDFVILLFETMYIALLFAGVAYSVYSINTNSEKKLPNVLYPLTIIFLKHTLNLLISSVIDSYIDLTFDIPVTLLLVCADALLVSLVWLIADRQIKKHLERVRKIQKAAKYVDTAEYNEQMEIYPFGGFFNFKHPILSAIAFGALITTLSFIVQRAYADFVVLGAPTTIFEIIEMILAYFLDIVLGVVTYATAYFGVSYIFLKHSTKN